MNTTFETNFMVMPTDANHLSPLIFGGAFFSQMDLCAANTVRRFLYDSETATGAVTHKVLNLTWFKPCYVGDLVYLRGQVVSWGQKSVSVEVLAEREEKISPDVVKLTKKSSFREKVAEGTFVFVAIAAVDTIKERPMLLPYVKHGVKQ